MAFYTYTTNPIGQFVEAECGNYFEYSINDCPLFDGDRDEYPHIVWVGGEGVCGMRGYRYAKVKKTVAYIAVDEDENGDVVEKWNLKRNTAYSEVN